MTNDWLQHTLDGFAIMSGREVIAALLGLAYIILAAKESLWCWPMAFIIKEIRITASVEKQQDSLRSP